MFNVQDDMATRCIHSNFIASALNAVRAFAGMPVDGPEMGLVTSDYQGQKPRAKLVVPLTPKGMGVEVAVRAIEGRVPRLCTDR